MLVSFVAVALAALATASPAKRAPASKVPAGGAVYEEISHYANFIGPAEGYPGIVCKHPPFNTQVLKFYSTTLTSTQALMLRDDNRKEFILALPGTNGLGDQLTDTTTLNLLYLAPDVQCPGLCLVHLGFLDAWNSLYPIIKDDLANGLKQYPGYSTVVTGHSLGGAIATLAFASLKADPQYRVSKAFTYGGPRVGNQQFADYVDKLAGASDTDMGSFYRVTHANDPIPNSVPYDLGFRHSRTEYWEQTMVPSEFSTYRCFGQEPSDCNLSTSGESITDDPAHTSYAGIAYSGCN